MPARKKRPAKARVKRPLDSLKYEVARELNLPKEVFEEGYWGNLSSRQCGAVGGQMVKRMIEAAQEAIAEEAASQAIAGFRSGLGLPPEIDKVTPEG